MKFLKPLLFCLVSFLFGIATVLLINFYISNNTQYSILVDSSLYKLCSKIPLPEPFILICKNNIVSTEEKDEIPMALHIQQMELYGPIDSLWNLEENPLCKRYFLEKTLFLPTLQQDENGKSSFVLYAENDLPENQEALPTNWLYAGEQNYNLMKTKYAQAFFCMDLKDELKNSLLTWLESVFGTSTEEQEPPFFPEENTVFIAAVGDIMVARGVEYTLMADNGPEKIFSDTLPLLQNSDFTIGNLEGAITGSNAKAIKTYTFKFNKKILPELQKAGFDYLMLTNNHSFDYGQQGFLDTLAALKEYNIPTSGVGKNLAEAREFYRTNINGLEISVLSCGAFPVEQSGFNGKRDASATDQRPGILWQSEEIFDLVKKEKEQGRFVIINVHGGQEYVFMPSTAQRNFYQGLCDSGADIIFGSHPHVLQPIEWYNGSIIAYSLGNFVFPGMEEMPGGTDSMVLRLGIYNGKILYKEEYPAKLEGLGVKLK